MKSKKGEAPTADTVDASRPRNPLQETQPVHPARFERAAFGFGGQAADARRLDATVTPAPDSAQAKPHRECDRTCQENPDVWVLGEERRGRPLPDGLCTEHRRQAAKELVDAVIDAEKKKADALRADPALLPPWGQRCGPQCWGCQQGIGGVHRDLGLSDAELLEKMREVLDRGEFVLTMFTPGGER